MMPIEHFEPRRWLRVLSVLARARRLDQHFNGDGRYEAETYRRHRRAIDQAWVGLAQFDAEYGEDRDAFYAAYGPPARLSEAAKTHLEVRGDSIPSIGEAAVAVAKIGSLLAWLECDHAEVMADDDKDATPYCVGVIHSIGYGAILLDRQAQIANQYILDSLLEERIVDVRNALRHLGWTGEAEQSQPCRPKRLQPLRRMLKARTWEFDHISNRVGAGRNVISLECQLAERPSARSAGVLHLCRFSDAMLGSALDIAALCEEAVQSACVVRQQKGIGRTAAKRDRQPPGKSK